MKNLESKRVVLDNSVIEDLKSLQQPGEPDFFLSLVDLYLETADESVQKIQDAIAKGNFRGIADSAHSLKSSSANIGALQFAKICFELEKIGEGNGDSLQLNTLANDFAKEYCLVEAELKAIKSAA